MRSSLRLASSFALVGLVQIACGGSEPPPAPPPPPTPPPAPTQVIAAPVAAEDAGAPVAVASPAATPSIVAKRQGTIRDLAVDDRWTYWLTEDGDVKRAPSSGGPALKVEGVAGATGLVVFGGKMYISAADPKAKGFSLLRADPNLANKPDVLATQAGTSAFLAADHSHVVWGTATGKKLALVVLGPEVKGTKKVEPIDASAPSLLALGPKNACYLDGHDVRTPLLFGKNDPKKPLGFSIEGADIRALGVAGNRIFVAESRAGSDDEHEDIMSTPVEGGVVDLVTKDQANVTSFVGDDDAIYWTARGTKAAAFADGKIMKANARTNEATLIVDKQRAPTKIALDPENVIWTNDNADDSAVDTDVLRIAR